VDVDSTWETGFNNFVFDTGRYPNASAMVEEFHSMGIRVIFWITNMVDVDSPNYKDGESKGWCRRLPALPCGAGQVRLGPAGYYLRNALNKTGVVKWWHGKGSMLDYTNPAAVEWWHQQVGRPFFPAAMAGRLPFGLCLK
jgi:alpha-glucosidase (family GH31 glycosyl hydrolase)